MVEWMSEWVSGLVSEWVRDDVVVIRNAPRDYLKNGTVMEHTLPHKRRRELAKHISLGVHTEVK